MRSERPSVALPILSTAVRELDPQAVNQFEVPDKRLLAAKLHGFYALNAPEAAAPVNAKPRSRKKTGSGA